LCQVVPVNGTNVAHDTQKKPLPKAGAFFIYRL